MNPDDFEDDVQLPLNPVEECVYLVPAEKFVYRLHGRWAIESPVTKAGLRSHLLHLGCDKETLGIFLKNELWRSVHGVDLVPNEPDLALVDGRYYINTWVPPTLQPTPGDYPIIRRVLSHLTGHDPDGVEWLTHWIAAKVQSPAFVPKVAVVLSTTPGAGKGFLAAVIKACLGEDNCASITRGALESRFNTRWANKLFVLADEVVAGDQLKDLSEGLKVLIDASHIELEGKGQNQRTVRNRLAWIFASNSYSPVSVETGDRRYTVFENTASLEPEYVDTLNACFEDDRTTPTAAFRAEQAAFLHDLLSLKVDLRRITRPYQNQARLQLQEASRSTHELFVEAVNDGGLEELLDRCVQQNVRLETNRAEWDWGTDGVSTTMLYQAYREFCARTGGRPMRDNRFGVVVGKRWPRTRHYVASKKKQVSGYVVPRGVATTRPSAPTGPRLIATSP